MRPLFRLTQPYQLRSRAVAKTVCYRGFMIVVTVCVALLIVGDVSDALNIGIATNLVKTVTYYLYERLWDRIDWGISPTI
ncbi:DUF2061 domain-containing protein [Halomarina halobia]|uniref:DUF2061 domain-containing protein n=1 Tax=Halomarina halobia TaxID=3033386 RepID=A0ABD6AE63_9EURY|nr:DUF2061 domain-containing protein [Halomarina sp. PSR21]